MDTSKTESTEDEKILIPKAFFHESKVYYSIEESWVKFTFPSNRMISVTLGALTVNSLYFYHYNEIYIAQNSKILKSEAIDLESLGWLTIEEEILASFLFWLGSTENETNFISSQFVVHYAIFCNYFQVNERIQNKILRLLSLFDIQSDYDRISEFWSYHHISFIFVQRILLNYIETARILESLNSSLSSNFNQMSFGNTFGNKPLLNCNMYSSVPAKSTQMNINKEDEKKKSKTLVYLLD